MKVFVLTGEVICHLPGGTYELVGSLAQLTLPLDLLTENFACICSLMTAFNRPHFAESGYWASCLVHYHAYSRQSAFS